MGETDFSTLEKVRNVDIAPPRSINPAIPEEVERVILKALAKDVDDRYQWCSEMLADLQAFLMSQDVVFTAKSLSSWLKEVFAQEIERERQQLEQYKRVGRDGLIGGVPSAEADKDVVSQLGEAGAPEGDATTLGGPSFDDIEQAIANNAAPSVDGAGPHRRGGTQDDGGNDFGEEAPTEIFGDSLNPSLVPVAAQQSRPSPATMPPQSRPPRPPPGRAPTASRPQEVPVSASAGTSGPIERPSVPSMPPPPQYAPAAASPQAGMSQPYPGQYAPPGALGSDPGQAHGTPNQIQAQSYMTGSSGPNQAPARTVLGMTAPVLPGGMHQSGSHPMPGAPVMQGQHPPSGPYGQPPYHPTGQQPAQPGYPQYPQYPQVGSYPSGSMPGYNQHYGYPGTGPISAPHDHLQPQVEGRRSTLVRDILIGVAIAALVLGGFFVVKIFILDKRAATPTTPATSTIATIHIAMAAGVSADLIIDDKKIATVQNGQDIPVTAGERHVVLAGASGSKCETTVKLEAGKTTPLKCQLASAPAAGSGAGSAAGSAAVPANAGSGAALGSGATTGSAAGSGAGSAVAPAGAGSATTIDAAKAATAAATASTVSTAPSSSTTKPRSSSTTTTPDKPDKPDKSIVHSTRTEPKIAPAEPHKTEGKTESRKSEANDGSKDKGYLTVASKPVAKILVDGADTGLSTPITGKSLALAPGRHKITFVMGDDRYTFPVTIAAGKTEKLDKDLE